MTFTQTLLIITAMGALSCTASANQTFLDKNTITDETVKSTTICPSFPTCPRGGNEEEPPAKSS